MGSNRIYDEHETTATKSTASTYVKVHFKDMKTKRSQIRGLLEKYPALFFFFANT